MTKEEILEYFKNINHAYNNAYMYDTLKSMLDELTEPCENCISRNKVLEGKVIHQSCDGVEIVNGYAVPVEYIEQLPSIQPKPKTDVLDKIRVEIEEHINYNKKMNYQGIVAGLLLTLDIIDKYKAESEGRYERRKWKSLL